MAAVIRTLARRLGLRVFRAATADALVRRSQAVPEIVAVLTAPPGLASRDAAHGIVFSMDRAIQLEALLASYVAHVANPSPLHILYRASSNAHQLAYEQAIASYDQVIASVSIQTRRSTFRDQLLAIVERIDAAKLFFFVDDDIIVEPFDLSDLLRIDTRVAIPSLRLGANLDRTYMLNKAQSLPNFRRWGAQAPEDGRGVGPPSQASRDDLLCWRWSEGEYDWAYPLSVDGNLFSTAEIATLARHTVFDSPNTFENGLQEFNDLFACRLGVCFRKSRLVNIPCNKVQADNANTHGQLHQADLLRRWQDGYRIDHASLAGLSNVSAHQEIDLVFEKRNGVNG